MTIEDISAYAKEKGLSPKKIDALIAELHPSESGELSLEESAQALVAINYHAETKEFIRAVLESTKYIRSQQRRAKTK